MEAVRRTRFGSGRWVANSIGGGATPVFNDDDNDEFVFLLMFWMACTNDANGRIKLEVVLLDCDVSVRWGSTGLVTPPESKVEFER